jgi:hypothetical protein
MVVMSGSDASRGPTNGIRYFLHFPHQSSTKRVFSVQLRFLFLCILFCFIFNFIRYVHHTRCITHTTPSNGLVLSIRIDDGAFLYSFHFHYFLKGELKKRKERRKKRNLIDNTVYLPQYTNTAKKPR